MPRAVTVGLHAAIVAVTEDEESNLVSCLMAKHLEVRKTVALLSKSAYIPISQSIGLDAALGRATLSGGFLTRRTLTNGRFGELREFGVFEADATARFGATLDLGRVRPGLDVRVPLYDTTLEQDATVGLRVDVAFP